MNSHIRMAGEHIQRRANSGNKKDSLYQSQILPQFHQERQLQWPYMTLG